MVQYILNNVQYILNNLTRTERPLEPGDQHTASSFGNLELGPLVPMASTSNGAPYIIHDGFHPHSSEIQLDELINLDSVLLGNILYTLCYSAYGVRSLYIRRYIGPATISRLEPKL
jgi:hypothetical protein